MVERKGKETSIRKEFLIQHQNFGALIARNDWQADE